MPQHRIPQAFDSLACLGNVENEFDVPILLGAQLTWYINISKEYSLYLLIYIIFRKKKKNTSTLSTVKINEGEVGRIQEETVYIHEK